MAGRYYAAQPTHHTSRLIRFARFPSVPHLSTFSQEHLEAEFGLAAGSRRCCLFSLGSKTKKTFFILTAGVSAVTGRGLCLENIFLHETWQVPLPYNISRCEQVTIRALMAHSYMKLVPDLGSFAARDAREGRAHSRQNQCQFRKQGSSADISLREEPDSESGLVAKFRQKPRNMFRWISRSGEEHGEEQPVCASAHRFEQAQGCGYN